MSELQFLATLTMNQVAPLMSLILGTLSMLAVILVIFKAPPFSSAVKLLGSQMVMSLAFAANDPLTYPLAIFLSATLMTNLNFLEYLAALFMRDRGLVKRRAQRAARTDNETGAE